MGKVSLFRGIFYAEFERDVKKGLVNRQLSP
jgi:hypothetical protein